MAFHIRSVLRAVALGCAIAALVPIGFAAAAGKKAKPAAAKTLASAQKTKACKALANQLSASIDKIVDLDRKADAAETAAKIGTAIPGAPPVAGAVAGQAAGNVSEMAETERGNANGINGKMRDKKCVEVDLEKVLDERAAAQG